MKLSFSICALSLSTVLVAACAADPSTRDQLAMEAAAFPSDAICAKEYMTGSHIATTTCRSRDLVEAEKATATRGLGRVQTGGPNAKQGGD